MALYTKQIFVPAGSLQSNPVITTVTIRENTIVKVDVLMDTVATKGTVGVKISVGMPGFKVWNLPADAQDYIIKAETYIENIVLPQVGLPLSIICQSEDAVKNHTVIVSVHTATTTK